MNTVCATLGFIEHYEITGSNHRERLPRRARSHALETVIALMSLLFVGALAVRAANVPVGFTETVIPGPAAGTWGKPVGAAFDSTGRMLVWERVGRIWIKGPTETNFTQLLSIEEELADEGMLGFALDPNFTVNGYIYLLYIVDRHHLLYFGTTNYNPSTTVAYEATIGRVTRYTCVASNDFKSVDLASRLVLLGESKTNGVPILGTTHNLGSLVFGEDGTLLVSTGDTASFNDVDLGGSAGNIHVGQGLADGILRPKEDVGGYRSQLVDCLNGKVLRINPANGNGYPSNPFYDPANPRAARSRVWALGFRNPCRMTLRPESGSHNPADGNPGVLYVGEVGWDTKEALKVVTGPGQNFGWPLFEGLDLTPDRGASQSYNVDVANLDAPNPLYPGSGCSPYFSFRQLLKQETTNAAGFPPFNNPCNASVKIPTNIPQFLFHRPALDWDHFGAVTRTPTFNASGNATIASVGAAGSPVSGTQFQGNCSIGGAWYTGTVFPAAYQNRYFHSDWGQQVIKLLSFDANNRPTNVSGFGSATGPVVFIVQHPFDGSLYFVVYDGDTGTVRKLSYTGNRTPVAVASSDLFYGPGPLTVQFNGSGSSDPDGQPLTYSWNFGDGTPVSTAPNPSHIFTPPGSTRTNYLVTLTVIDTGGLPANATINIAVNDTPPSVTITSPTNGAFYSVSSNTPFNLVATVSDAESTDSQLQYLWQTVLHHNDHNHVEGTSTNHVSSTLVDPVGCDGMNIYYYRVILTVTDPRGLATSREVRLFPDCGTTDTPPTISDIPDQGTAISLATVPIPFTIGDAQVAAGNLQLSASSSNPTLVPTNNITFGGSGANRTVTVGPASGLNGTATITVTVNDGPHDVSDGFVLTVTGTNTPPTISGLVDQSTSEGTPTAANAFTIGDANTPAANLTLTGTASDPSFVPANNIVFGGSGSNRIVTVTPAPGQLGNATITVVVSDGQLSASNGFTLTVTGLPAGSKSFTNTTAIMVPDVAAASPYPSTINVTGLGGSVTNVTVTLRSLSYQWGRDLDVLLVAPGGQAMIVMSDAGTGPTATNANLIFSDGAAAFLVQTGMVAGGTYKPTDYPPADTFPAPAPAGPYATNLAAFNGGTANGTWLLYVLDDGPGDTGSIAGGWSLTIATQPVASSNTPPAISAISNQVTVVNTATAALAFTVSDADTAASNLVLTASSSNPGLVPTNNMVVGGSGTNRTVTVTPAGNQLGSATLSLTVSDGQLTATNSFVVTVNPAPLTVTENSFSRGYGVTNPVLTGSVVGLQAGDSITANFSTTAGTNSPVGVYGITFTLTDPGGKLGNYVITTNQGTLTVTPAVLVVTANSTNKGYGSVRTFVGTEFAITSGALFNGNTLTNVTLSSTGSASNAPVGSYAITATNALGTGLTNYNLSYSNGTLTVTSAALVVTANSTNKGYGSVRTFAGTEFAITSGALFNGNTLTNVTLSSTGSASNATVGSYAITATNALGSGLTNYSLSYSNGTLTVTPAVLVATARDKTRVYGQANPVFTISYAGFVIGDDTNVLDELPVAGSTATNTSAPGDYQITVTGGADNNYALSRVAGTLTITAPGPVTITAVEFVDALNLRITGTGDAQVSYKIQASTDLVIWNEIGLAPADDNGAFEHLDTATANFATRYYRVVLP